jgi:hypothetical protein
MSLYKEARREDGLVVRYEGKDGKTLFKLNPKRRALRGATPVAPAKATTPRKRGRARTQAQVEAAKEPPPSSRSAQLRQRPRKRPRSSRRRPRGSSAKRSARTPESPATACLLAGRPSQQGTASFPWGDRRGNRSRLHVLPVTCDPRGYAKSA